MDFVDANITQEEADLIMFAATQMNDEGANHILRDTRFTMKGNTIYVDGEPVGTVEIELH